LPWAGNVVGRATGVPHPEGKVSKGRISGRAGERDGRLTVPLKENYLTTNVVRMG
jgi:hypothetical protein